VAGLTESILASDYPDMLNEAAETHAGAETTVAANGDTVSLKQGRVLSAANLERLKGALAVLAEILQAAEPPDTEAEKAARLALTQRNRSLVLRALTESI
jgi:hypothetical protein